MSNSKQLIDLQSIGGIVSDLDGVTYRGDSPIPSAVAAFQHWHRRGIPFVFVTNNSTKSAGEFAAKLKGMGIAASTEDVITTSSVTAAIVKKAYPSGTAIYVIGSKALAQAIEEAGFVISDRDAKVVVAGLDREFTYQKLATAQQIIMAGADFYGTNPDLVLPHETGFEPGAGSILAAIEASTGQKPKIVGKPEPSLVEFALQRLGTARDQTLMIGDQVATDIAAGAAAGVQTLLVKTGVPETGPRALDPDFECNDLSEILTEPAVP